MFENLEKNINDKLKKAVNDGLKILKKSIDEKTPEDTFKLIKNNKIKEAEQDGNIIKGSVYNETKYGLFVEYGVKSKEYNYYKNSGRRKGLSPFYTGIGARMFTRGYDEKKQEINNIIKNSIKGIQ